MNEEYYTIPEICKNCMNWTGEDCLLLPVEEEICLTNNGEFFVPREEKNCE